MKRFFLFLSLVFIISGCVSKGEQKVEKTAVTTTIEKRSFDIDKDLLLEVFNKLVFYIKKRDLDGISSCYSKDSLFLYDDSTGNFSCFNGLKQASGNDEVIEQYKYMFKKRILDNIEFEVYLIDANIENPSIKFINAWQNSDYDFEEIVYFAKEDEKYKI
ncbi:MAG TPA: hypothetical protein PLO89_03930, partial [Spirochaetota bacterium]|nr:hypothetical protein [Spirochaetota bacterium]